MAAPHPPRRWRPLLVNMLLPVLAPLCLPLGILPLYFPYLLYVLFHRPAEFVPYLSKIERPLITGEIGRIAFVLAMVLFVMLAIPAWQRYQREQRHWRDRLARGMAPYAVELAHPVILPPPAAAALTPVEVRVTTPLSKTLVTLSVWGAFALFALLGWLQLFFRWPPDPVLQACIWGSFGGLVILGIFSALIGRYITSYRADDVGLTQRAGRHTTTLPWSAVRQVLVAPLSTKGDAPDEAYLFVGGDSFIEIPTGRRSSAVAQRQDARALVAFGLQRTRVPLQAEREAVIERDALLTQQQGKGFNGVKLLTGLLLIAVGIGPFLLIQPWATYHAVTGRISGYTLARKEATITLEGVAISYSLSTNGVFPSPPATLPQGATATLWVDGRDVGHLDASTETQEWHITTQGYAEPWSKWLTAGAIAVLFWGLGGVFMVSAVGMLRRKNADEKQQRDFFPAPNTVEDAPPSHKPKMSQDLHFFIARQGTWWGVEPKVARELALCTGLFALFLWGCAIALLVTLTPDDAQSVAGAIGTALGGAFLSSLVWLLWRTWQRLRQQNSDGFVTLHGTIESWARSQLWNRDWGETLVQFVTDTGEEHLLRVRKSFRELVRTPGARVQIMYQPVTGYVQTIDRLP